MEQSLITYKIKPLGKYLKIHKGEMKGLIFRKDYLNVFDGDGSENIKINVNKK